jgi:hypothetical protein
MRRTLLLTPVAFLLCGTATAATTPTRSVTKLSLRADVRYDTAVSSNWSGYAIGAATTFTSVSGRWIQPTAQCTSSRSTLTASVKVTGTSVTVQIRNLTRRTKFTKTLRMSNPDTTSAEWVAEAPSACSSSGRCLQLPLTNFGSVTFSSASATTSDGHTGTIGDSAWSVTPIELIEDSPRAFATSETTSSGAVPEALSSDGASFSIVWQDAIALPPSAAGAGA